MTLEAIKGELRHYVGTCIINGDFSQEVIDDFADKIHAAGVAVGREKAVEEVKRKGEFGVHLFDGEHGEQYSVDFYKIYLPDLEAARNTP